MLREQIQLEFTKTSLYNVVRKIKQNENFWNEIQTYAVNPTSDAEALYCYLNEVQPKTCECGSGKLLNFISLKNGYNRACSKHCSHALAIRTKNFKDTKSKDREYDESLPLKVILQQILDNSGEQVYGSEFLRYPQLIQQLKDKFGDLHHTQLFYLGLNPDTNYHCECGNIRSFGTIKTGFNRFCSSTACNARRENQRTVIEKSIHNKSIDEQAEIAAKRRATNLERYGAETPFESEKVQETIKQTLVDKYGVTNAYQVPHVREKYLAETGFKTPFFNPEVQKQIQTDLIEKYGGLMTHARKAVYEKYDGVNPFKVPEVQEKRRQVLLERYGREHPKQIGISDRSFKLLNDKVAFEEMLNENNLRQAAKLLDVGEGVILGWAERYGILNQVKRVASYEETAIADVIRSCGFGPILNKKTIIAPKQLDIYVPEKKLAIEYCGIYWHSEDGRGKRGKTYHFDKWVDCLNNEIKLLTIFEDEWLFKQDQVIELIKHNLTGSEIENSFAIAGESIIVYDGDIEIGLVNAQVKGNSITLDTSNILNLNNKKLVEFIENNFTFDEIIVYIDLRIDDGMSLRSIGFNEIGLLDPISLKADCARIARISSDDNTLSNIWDCGYLIMKR